MKSLFVAFSALLVSVAHARVVGSRNISDVGVGSKSGALTTSVRSLHVRSIPAVEGVNSNIYEIYMEPYTYPIRPLTAVVELHSEQPEGAVKGELTLTQIHPPNGPVLITGNITGLSKGHHGFHVHEAGDLRKGCASVGEHFNPYRQQHGGPIDPFRHIGDLGNIIAADDGVAQVQLWDHAISLIGSHNVMGRSIVIHGLRDDLGRGGGVESIKTGNAGPSVACGVVAHIVSTPTWEWTPLGPGLPPVAQPDTPPPPAPPPSAQEATTEAPPPPPPPADPAP